MPRVKLFDEEALLEKAMNFFSKKGYHATSIQDLVNYLGINRGSLYDTYGGKKQLFVRAFRFYQVTNAKAVKQFLHSHENVKTGFEQLFSRALRESYTDPEKKGCFVVNTTIELIPNDQDFAALISSNKQQFEGIFHDYLITGVKSGQFSPEKDLPSIAVLLFTFYNGLKVVTKVDFDVDLFSKSVDTLLSVLD